MAFRVRKDPALPVATEDTTDILSLTRLHNHPVLAPLMERREHVRERTERLTQERRQMAGVLTDFERLHALPLAEEQPALMEQWRGLKQRLSEHDDQMTLVQTGLGELEAQIDASAGMVRDEIARELDERRAPHVAAMVEGLQALAPHNQALQQIERASLRLLRHTTMENVDGMLGWRLRWLQMTQARLARAGITTNGTAG
jgi:hypothetical protein